MSNSRKNNENSSKPFTIEVSSKSSSEVADDLERLGEFLNWFWWHASSFHESSGSCDETNGKTSESRLSSLFRKYWESIDSWKVFTISWIFKRKSSHIGMAQRFSLFHSSSSHLIQISIFSDDTSEHMLSLMRLKKSSEKRLMFSRLVSLRRFLNMISFRKSSCDAIRESDISIMISSSHRRTEQSSQIVSSFLHYTPTIHISTMRSM